MLTSGCGAPMVGIAGIGVDQAGNPVGYLRVCDSDKHLDGATVHPDGSDDDYGSWKSNKAVTGVATWPLAGPAPGWTTETTPKPRTAGVLYDLYGWTTDNSASTAEVAFTAADLAGLQPGQVRYAPGDSDKYTVTSEEEFRTGPC